MSKRAGFSLDDLVDMMDLLDSDGDGEVTKEEFKTMFCRVNRLTDAQFENEWVKIDTNGDGNLQMNELCDYYGVNVNDVENNVAERRAMSDEKILELLQMQAELQEEKLRRERQSFAMKRRQSNARLPGLGNARPGVLMIPMEDTSPKFHRARRNSKDMLVMDQTDDSEQEKENPLERLAMECCASASKVVASNPPLPCCGEKITSQDALYTPCLLPPLATRSIFLV